MIKLTKFEYAKTLDRHVEPFLGHLPLTEIRPLLLNEWQQQRLAAGAGREAIAKAEKLLGQILSRAVALELLASNAALTLQHPRTNTRHPIIATPVEVEAIRAWFFERGRLGDASLISLLAYVGVRPMEALALHWSDVDGNRLSVAKALSDGVFKTTKTRHQRLVQIPRPVVKDLHEWRIAMGRRQHLIWPRRLDGGPWHQADWNNWRRRWFKKAAKAAGIEHLVPYDLRHSAASIFIAAGRPQTEVAAQLGHSLEVSTRTYQHLIESTQGQPSKSIDAWIREARVVSSIRTRGVPA